MRCVTTFAVIMMVQFINDNIFRSTHTITVRTSARCHTLPVKKLNIRNSEWSFCGLFDDGEVSIALLLDYSNQKLKGFWAGMHGEIYNKNGFLMNRMTKMNFMRPRQSIGFNMRLLPKNYYNNNLSSNGEPFTKGCFYIRINTTFCDGYTSLEMEKLLTCNNCILQTVSWPTARIRPVIQQPDCTITFFDRMQFFVHKASTLSKLNVESPMHEWNNNFPDSKVFCAEIDPEIQDKSIMLFYKLLITNTIPWKKYEIDILHDMLLLAKYFKFDLLLRLCGVQLIYMLRKDMITPNMFLRLRQLELPSINGIIECHKVTSMIIPDIGSSMEHPENDA